jgi:hypothetical protein
MDGILCEYPSVRAREWRMNAPQLRPGRTIAKRAFAEKPNKAQRPKRGDNLRIPVLARSCGLFPFIE